MRFEGVRDMMHNGQLSDTTYLAAERKYIVYGSMS